MMTGSMIEAMFVSHDPDVRKIAEEDRGCQTCIVLPGPAPQSDSTRFAHCRVQNLIPADW